MATYNPTEGLNIDYGPTTIPDLGMTPKQASVSKASQEKKKILEFKTSSILGTEPGERGGIADADSVYIDTPQGGSQEEAIQVVTQ